MVRQENIWKFNDEEWKVHITDIELLEQAKKKFDLGNSITIYYESGSLSKETSWDIIVPNNKINKVKKFIKDNT
jgi:zona occludens toxin (predicted ATPase)|tara:strand:- start:167 stop:388 length:222 start_codon:yes stop_codon:yes gene_type:complete